MSLLWTILWQWKRTNYFFFLLFSSSFSFSFFFLFFFLFFFSFSLSLSLFFFLGIHTKERERTTDTHNHLDGSQRSYAEGKCQFQEVTQCTVPCVWYSWNNKLMEWRPAQEGSAGRLAEGIALCLDCRTPHRWRSCTDLYTHTHTHTHTCPSPGKTGQVWISSVDCPKVSSPVLRLPHN